MGRHLYLCAVKDVHSTKIVGYSIDSHMKPALVNRPGFGGGTEPTGRWSGVSTEEVSE